MEALNGPPRLFSPLPRRGDSSGGRGSGPSEPTPACEQARHRLEEFQTRAVELAAKIATLEGRLGSGDLTAKQEKKALPGLAKLQKRLVKVEKRIDKAEARVATRCGEEPTDPPDEPPGPTE